MSCLTPYWLVGVFVTSVCGIHEQVLTKFRNKLPVPKEQWHYADKDKCVPGHTYEQPMYVSKSDSLFIRLMPKGTKGA